MMKYLLNQLKKLLIKYPLTHIINRSLPNQLEISNVIPVLKASDPTELKNYRPISFPQKYNKIHVVIIFFINMSMVLGRNTQQFTPFRVFSLMLICPGMPVFFSSKIWLPPKTIGTASPNKIFFILL